MTKRRIISSGTKWEEIVGYSRAVQVGNQLEISGTVAVDDQGVIVGEGDFFRQAEYILQKISVVLKQAGFGFEDVVRTRMYVTDITKWEEVGRAHGAVFREIKPSTSMVEVRALIDPGYLVEIEVTAIKKQKV